ncbi:ubiquitin carboxyl-terminal hydrolase 30-like [Clytia hemisphaerica]|uniref:Ubiquitin carboxyl-terminal hydrolase n=1 Tax=Clytia hemisphaerica TaxID=252671 RepID=A0A7M5X700_9CNID
MYTLFKNMDFFKINLHFAYYKFLWYKYKLLLAWDGSSTFSKCVVWLLSSGTLALAYRFYVKSSNTNIEQNQDQIEAVSKRRKKGLPPGLFNEGNTCFINSVLQAISSSSSARKWIYDIEYKESSVSLTTAPSLDILIKVLSNQCGNEDVYSALDLMLSLASHGWVISNQQHDAYEFFQLLIATVNEEMEKVSADGKSFYLIGEVNTASSHIMNRISQTLPSLQRSPSSYFATDPFKGSVANKLTCTKCSYQSPIKFEKFGSLILSIQHASLQRGCTLESCFQKLIETEYLSDVVCEKCTKENNNCKVKTKFQKQTSLSKLPQCLCLQLQRTYYTNDGSTRKNAAFVRFPEFLDVSPFRYSSKDSKSKINIPDKTTRPLLCGGSSNFSTKKSSAWSNWYRLISVVLHYGDAYDGHFAVFRRTPGDQQKWVYISDQQVKRVSKRTVFDSFAYLLFYEKI